MKILRRPHFAVHRIREDVTRVKCISALTKSQYRWPTRMTMNADRKLINQPSVDSENNERVTSERVGSSRFRRLYRLGRQLILNEKTFRVSASSVVLLTYLTRVAEVFLK